MSKREKPLNLTGAGKNVALRVSFDRRVKLEFHGSQVTSDAGLLAYRDLEEALSLTRAQVHSISPRTAAEVEHSGPRFQTQRRAESGELFGCDRVVDAVSAFRDVEYSWDVHCGDFLTGVNRFG